jgi:GNAT superfamily N-acetyltransferase
VQTAVTVRPASPADLPALQSALDQRTPGQEALDQRALGQDAPGQGRYFAERLERQRQGRGVLLIAWDGATPVGTVYLWLEPAEEPELREWLPDAPLIIRLEVRPDRRGQRIGTRLMEAAEQIARERGRTEIALGVGLDNKDAMRLYERRGYRLWRAEPIGTRAESYAEDGTLVVDPDDACLVYWADLADLTR